MGTRVGTGGGVVGKDGGGAVLIRRRELRVPSSVKRCFVQKSITESRCKKKKKKSSTKNLSFFFFSFFSFFFFPFLFSRRETLAKKCPRESMWSNVTWNLELSSRSLSLFLDRKIYHIYIYFLLLLIFFLSIFFHRGKWNGNENWNEQKEKRETVTDFFINFDRVTNFSFLLLYYAIKTTERKGHIFFFFFIIIIILLLQSSRKVSPTDLVC